MNIVVIGFGVAGATAAEKVKSLNPKADVIVFGQERELFYYRVRLPEVIAGKLSLEEITVHPRHWYKEKGLDVRTGESVVEIDLEHQALRGSIGSRLYYDRILLATGAQANRLPLPGAGLPQVWCLRRWSDAWAINLAAARAKTAVIIGGGLLGLEAAAALAGRGLETTVIDISPRLLHRQTTVKSAAILQKTLEKRGLKFILAAATESILGAHQAQGVRLTDGREIPADIVILSAGVTPDLELAKSVGLAVEQGITVNDYLETSIPNIYAAGDACQHQGRVCGLWTTARSQGLTAGTNLAVAREDRQAWAPIVPANTLKVAGFDLTAAGNLDNDDQHRHIEAFTEDYYRRVVLDQQGRVIGFTIAGAAAGVRELNQAFTENRELTESAVQELERPQADFSLVLS